MWHHDHNRIYVVTWWIYTWALNWPIVQFQVASVPDDNPLISIYLICHGLIFKKVAQELLDFLLCCLVNVSAFIGQFIDGSPV